MTTLRTLRSAALLLLAALAPATALRADAVADARAHLADGDFAAMKKTLDTYLKVSANQGNQTAYALRAIASTGLVARDSVPALLKKSFGAQRAGFDPAAGDFELFFPEYKFTFAGTKSFVASGSAPATYGFNGSRAPEGGTRNDVPGLSIQNNSGDSYPLTLRFNLSSGSPSNTRTYFRINSTKDALGFVQTNGASVSLVYQFAGFDITGLHPGPGVNEATIDIPSGTVLDIYTFESTGGSFSFTPTAPLPPTLTVRNGQVLFSLAPVAARTTPLGAALVPARALNASVAADLAKLAPGFSLVLSPEETGSATDLVFSYADAQLLLAEIKFLEGLRHLSLSYNLGFKFKYTALDTDFLAFLRNNPAFLNPVSDNSGLATSRKRARDFILAGVAHYNNASDAGIWTRPAPASGSHLFTFPADGDAAGEKLRYDTAFQQLADALAGPVPLAELSEDLADDSDVPDDATLDLGALFSDKVVNLRAALPAFAETGGIVRGSSTGVVNSGLLPGLGINGWDSFLDAKGLSDPAEATDDSPLKILRQSLVVTAAEGSPARLSVFAERYPPPTYKWSRLDGKVATEIPGAGASLVLPAVTRADAGRYQATVTDSREALPPKAPRTVTSKPIQLIVTYPPEISRPPAGGTFARGKTVTLSVAATGVPSKLAYQWRKNGQIILKATSSKYSFTAGADKAGVYDVIVTNLAGSTTSSPAVITAPPEISSKNQTVFFHVGDTRSLSFAVAGSGPLGYQWLRGGAPLEGKTDAGLSFPAVSASDAGAYSLRVSSPYGQATSATTTVKINLPPASLPAGTTLRFTEGETVNTYTVAASSANGSAITGTFTDNSTFDYKLKSESFRTSQGLLTDATLTRRSSALSGGGRHVYDLRFSTPGDATHSRTVYDANGKVVDLVLNGNALITRP